MAKVVGDIAVRVGADITQLQQGMKRAGGSVGRFEKAGVKSAAAFAKKLAGVGLAATAMAGAVMAASRKSISALDALGKKSAQIGITAEALQRLQFAAESAGVANSKLESSLERFSKRLGEANQGFGAAVRQLDALGLSAEQLTSMSLDEALGVVADKLAQIEDPAQRAATAAGLFGREGVAMVNMLRNGSAALEETMSAADRFGAVVSNETVAAAEELEDRLGRLGSGVRGQLNEALVEAGPLLIRAAEFALQLAQAFNRMVTQIGSTYNALVSFNDPAAMVADSIDAITLAMADEIEQSKLLELAMADGNRMSADTARLKLQEAQARHENAKAALAERNAMIANTEAQVGKLRATAASADPRSSRGLTARAEALQADLDAMRQADDGVKQQLERTESNVARLQEALANVKDGVVSFGEDVTPITPGDREKSGGVGGSAPTAEDVSPIEKMLGIDPESMELTQERMESAREKQIEHLEKQQEILKAALDRGLITRQEYNALTEAAEQQHADKMRRIKMTETAAILGSTASLFDAMANVSESGNKKLLRISKIFSAGEALINAWNAYTDVLANQPGDLSAKLAAGAAVLSAGLGAVSAIRGVSDSGGGSSSASSGGTGGATAASAAQAPATPTQTVAINLQGDTFSRASVEGLLEQIQSQLDRGGRLVFQ